jgi:hypothetical protein
MGPFVPSYFLVLRDFKNGTARDKWSQATGSQAYQALSLRFGHAEGIESFAQRVLG